MQDGCVNEIGERYQPPMIRHPASQHRRLRNRKAFVSVFLLHLCSAFCVIVPYFLKLSYPPEGPRYLHTPSSLHEIVKASPNPPKPSHDSLIVSNVGAQSKGFTFVISTEAWIITRTSPQGSLIIWSLGYHTLILFFLKEPF